MTSKLCQNLQKSDALLRVDSKINRMSDVSCDACNVERGCVLISVFYVPAVVAQVPAFDSQYRVLRGVNHDDHKRLAAIAVNDRRYLHPAFTIQSMQRRSKRRTYLLAWSLVYYVANNRGGASTVRRKNLKLSIAWIAERVGFWTLIAIAQSSLIRRDGSTPVRCASPTS